MYSHIFDLENNKKVSVFSRRGKKILRNYLLTLKQKGGAKPTTRSIDDTKILWRGINLDLNLFDIDGSTRDGIQDIIDSEDLGTLLYSRGGSVGIDVYIYEVNNPDLKGTICKIGVNKNELMVNKQASMLGFSPKIYKYGKYINKDGKYKYFIIMDRVNGLTMNELDDEQKESIREEWGDFYNILSRSYICHGDLRPRNIMYGYLYNDIDKIKRLWIIDWGNSFINFEDKSCNDSIQAITSAPQIDLRSSRLAAARARARARIDARVRKKVMKLRGLS